MKRISRAVFLTLALLLLINPPAFSEKFHLFFLEKQEGNLDLLLNRDKQNAHTPKNELFHYQVFYSGLLVGECLIKYKLNDQKFTAQFSSNALVLPRRASVQINPETLLPEKIEVVETSGAKKIIIYDQKNYAMTCGTDFKKLLYPIIEPITMVCIFRNFDLSQGRANFFFGARGELFSFDFSQRKKIKTLSGAEIYQYLSDPPKITLYLSDDTLKIPVGLIYDLFVGRLELKLKKYQK